MQRYPYLQGDSRERHETHDGSVVLLVASPPGTQRRLASVLNRAFPDGSVRLLSGDVSQDPTKAPRTATDVELQNELARLSGREEQVLSLIAKGMQITEVAQLLEIRANTVCSHIKNIYRKRQVSSRAEAALEAMRLGLV